MGRPITVPQNGGLVYLGGHLGFNLGVIHGTTGGLRFCKRSEPAYFTASSTIAASTTRKLRTGLFNVAQSGAFWQKPWTSVQHGVKFLPTRTRTERTIHDSSRTKLQTRKFVQWKSGSTKGVCGGVICERRAATTSLARRRWGQHCSKQALFF